MSSILYTRQIGLLLISSVYPDFPPRDHNVQDAITDPSRIWNCDETAVQIQPKRAKIISPTGIQEAYIVKPTNSKQNVTALATISAAGILLPPFLVLPGKRHMSWMKQIREEMDYELTPSGWMAKETFKIYLERQFLPKLKELHTTFPVILFFDGVSSHISLNILIF